MISLRRSLLASATLLCLVSPPALAGEKIGQILIDTVVTGVTLAPQSGHTPHFAGEESLGAVLGLNAAIAGEFGTYPLGSSSGGFSFTFDPNVGAYEQASATFGPLFAERALTLGKGKVNVGVTYVRSSFDQIDGIDLTNGDLAFNLRHENEGPPGTTDPDPSLYFEGDYIHTGLGLDLTLDRTLLFASYGVTDRFDLGVVLPWVKAKLDTTVNATVVELATAPDAFNTHYFGTNANQLSSQQTVSSASASGIGDVVLRGKYRFLNRDHSGLAGALDLRLPTGDEKDLLGSGATQGKLYVVGSTERGKFSLHGNLGYTFSSGSSSIAGDLPDEINYVGGFDVAVHPRVTLGLDVIGRNIRDAKVLERTTETFDYVFVNDPTVRTATDVGVLARTANLNVLQAAAGVKVNVSRGTILSGTALVSLSDDGLTDDFGFAIGLDYSFGKK